MMKFEFYCHTSSILVRRIPGGLEKRFRVTNLLRGDSAFLYYHALVLKGSLHYFPFAGSAYRIHDKGIWSGLTQDEKLRLHRLLFSDLQRIVVKDHSSLEHGGLEKKLQALEKS